MERKKELSLLPTFLTKCKERQHHGSGSRTTSHMTCHVMGTGHGGDRGVIMHDVSHSMVHGPRHRCTGHGTGHGPRNRGHGSACVAWQDSLRGNTHVAKLRT